MLYQRMGICLGENKQYLVQSRLKALMRDNNYVSLDELISDIVKGKTNELQEAALFAMTTNETYWFRDEYPFSILRDTLLPALLEKTTSLRIWSAACSTGQEPYSIAMTVLEQQRLSSRKFTEIKIVATDISQPVLDFATKGEYDSLAISRGLSQQRLSNFFTPKARSWLINDDVKRLVRFRPYNLLDGFGSLGEFDIIFCRNVLIYFNNETVATTLQKFSAQLPQGRYLFLGAAESAGVLNDRFKMIKQPQGLYYTRL